MRWPSTSNTAQGGTKWQPWFAWFPVRLQGGVTAWLETVQRIRVVRRYNGLDPYAKADWYYLTLPHREA